MKSFKKPDSVLLASIILLLGLGLVILGSVSPVYSMERFNDANYLMSHQILLGLLPGLVSGIFFFFLPLEKLKKISFFIFLTAVFLLSLLFLSKFGLKFLGASRWLNVGGLFTFQPAEFLKLAFIIYLAAWLSRKTSSEAEKPKKVWLSKLGLLAPFLVICGLIAILLALQPDVGTLGIVSFIGLAMFFMAGTPLWQTGSIILLGLAGLGLLIKIAPYRLSRLLIFLNPGADPTGQGYQISQALIAVGSGGFLGVGLGLSRQKFGFLPQTIGDAIFPVFAEEAGFLGAAILVLLFLIFLWRGLKTAFLAKDSFSRLLAVGIASWIGGQALINIGSMTGLLPLTGVPLPLVSYGGSHLAVEMASLGILLNVSKNT